MNELNQVLHFLQNHFHTDSVTLWKSWVSYTVWREIGINIVRVGSTLIFGRMAYVLYYIHHNQETGLEDGTTYSYDKDVYLIAGVPLAIAFLYNLTRLIYGLPALISAVFQSQGYAIQKFLQLVP